MYNIFFGRRKKFQLNKAETTYKVHYLGNVMTSLIKGGYHHGQKPFKSVGQSDMLFNDEEKNMSKLNLTDEEAASTNDEDDDEYTTETDSCVSLTSNKIVQETLSSNLNKRFNNIVCNVDKPVKILWDNHLKHNGHAGLKMKLTITQGGLRVDTKDHGLTEYYGHRIHFIQSHPLHPKLFIWVYQHVGKNLKTEIRCHAALCQSIRDSRAVETLLNERLQRTFLEYKREKRRMQNSRLCNSKNGLLAGQFGTRKRSFRSTKNYKPPVQHGMSSAPKLDDVIEEEEEICDERAIDTCNKNNECESHDYVHNQVHLEMLDEEVDESPEEDDEETNPTDQLCSVQQNSGHPTEQLVLSSSSSASSSQSSSPVHSNLSSPSLKNANTTSISSSSSSHSSHSSNSNQIYSEEHDLIVTTPDSPLKSSDLLVEINKLKKKQPLIEHSMEDLKMTNDDNQNNYTEVSYDFLGDKIQEPNNKEFKVNLAHSKSFSSHHNSSYQLASLIDSLTVQTKPLYNPFRRTNISKSFSTFTTRLKQHSQKQKTQAEFVHYQDKAAKNCNEISLKQSILKNQTRSSICNGSPIKNLSDSTSSPLSSPDLSTSSLSSLNSSIHNINSVKTIQCDSNDN